MWAIICDARKGRSSYIGRLALVDRAKCKTLWWTSDDPGIAMRYESKSAAQFAADRLTKNNARIMYFEDARRILERQARDLQQIQSERLHREAMADAELGWEGHKNAI